MIKEYEDGSVYVGEWSDGLPNGYGYFILKDDSGRMEGMWVDGYFIGVDLSVKEEKIPHPFKK